MITVNVVAVFVIVLWAFWCLMSKRVSDGIVGKILYLLLTLAALGVLSNPGPQADTALNCTVALIGVRHFWMKTFWPRIRSAALNRIRCATCPHKD